MKRLVVAVAGIMLVAALCALAAERGGEKPQPEKKKPARKTKPVEYGPGKLVCWAANRRITESSGVAASRTAPGVFWTHNDSGDDPTLYAFDLKGNSLGAFDILGRHRDWEDICTYKVGDKGYIVAADTGDNSESYGKYAIYICSEPKFKPDGKDEPLKVVGFPRMIESVSFTYGDGKSHDGESIAATPDGRTLYIVTRNRNDKECKAFRIERYTDKKGTKLRDKVVAEEIAELEYQDVSALDVSRDGLRMMVQTYDDGYEFTRKPKETWKDALKRKPRQIKLPPRGPIRRKGEGCTYGYDDVTLYLTSEHHKGCPLFMVPPKKKAK